MNKDINNTLMALVPVLRMNGENVKTIEVVQDWYRSDGIEYMKEVAELTYDNGRRLYADIGCGSNLTAVYDVVAVVQEIKCPSKAIERIVRDVYPMPKDDTKEGRTVENAASAAVVPYSVPYREALEKGYIEDIITGGGEEWDYEADVWFKLYYTFNDDNPRHASNCFWNNGFQNYSLNELRQLNMEFVTETASMVHGYDAFREMLQDTPENPIFLELADWCEKAAKNEAESSAPKEEGQAMNKPYDFRTNTGMESYEIFCDSCGKTSIVDANHKRYCPICGPGVVTPITVKKIKEAFV